MLTIQRANPLEVADSLRSLFATESQALAALVDTAYPDIARAGGSSWIGIDQKGQVQLNVTLVPHEFDFAGRTVRAGMLSNTVAARAYRWFFPSVSLVKQLIRDVSRDSEVDFLYTDPQPSAAAVSRAAGLDQLGALDRFVIPLTDARASRAVAARVYSTALNLRFAAGAARCTAIDSMEYDADRFGRPRGASPRLRPHHRNTTYRRRLREYPGPDYVWCEFRLPGTRSEREADAAVLLEAPDERNVAHVWAIRRAADVPLHKLIPGLLRAARRQGAHRLEVEVIRESALARELRRVGFRQRHDLVPLFGTCITPAGAEVVNAVHDWELTAFDMDR